MPERPSHRWRAAVAALALVATTAACTGERPRLLTVGPSTTAASTTTTAPGPEPSYVAEARAKTIAIYDSPDGKTTQTIDSADQDSKKIIFLVKERADPWVQVYLPVRPNGSTGWVKVSEVTVSADYFRVEIRLKAHNVKVYEKDKVVMDEPVGLGTGDTPTPGGVFYMNSLIKPPNPNGAYGVYAYGLSGFSNVLTKFNGGDGVIGLHGTNDPSSIGSDVSHGCIRMRNEAIVKLAEVIGLPLGTPVQILP